ncbi:hypothetical protein L7F22_055242 [Adiantum nelumboides]|nr:hypothetical protein [Adiantum nelumboides]
MEGSLFLLLKHWVMFTHGSKWIAPLQESNCTMQDQNSIGLAGMLTYQSYQKKTMFDSLKMEQGKEVVLLGEACSPYLDGAYTLKLSKGAIGIAIYNEKRAKLFGMNFVVDRSLFFDAFLSTKQVKVPWICGSQSLVSQDWKKENLVKECIGTQPLPRLENQDVGVATTTVVKSSLHDFKAAEERIFEAKITDVFHYGYTIESVISGRPLRGLLFSYKPGFAHAAHAYLTRKNLSVNRDAGGEKQVKESGLDLTHLAESGLSTAGVSLQNFGGKQGWPMQPAFSSSQSNLYLHSQVQSEMQHQTHYQQHYLYQHQVPHYHAPSPQQSFDPVYSQQHVQNPICALPQQEPVQDTDSGQNRAIQSADGITSSHQALGEVPGVVTVEGGVSSQGFMQTADDPSQHQASTQNTCNFTVQDPPCFSSVTSLPPYTSQGGHDTVAVHPPPTS